MYFYTICIAARLKKHNLPCTFRNVKNVSRGIFIYGDDIIVPNDDATVVFDYLQKYHCKVNMLKTFSTGKFRESCGMDSYNGEQVNPVYVRCLAPENKRQAHEIISYVATANLFYKKGFFRTASLLFTKVEKILGPLPYVSRDSQALGRKTFRNARSFSRWNVNIQCFEFKAWVPTPIHRSDELVGFSALSKSLLNLDARDLKSDIVFDYSSLEQSALHGAVTLKLRWLVAT